jgi:nucleoside-diphosphate-sugar epimerase
LRLAGIYGPGRNALTQVARGGTRRIVKPGQIFNRIHVADIAQAIDAAFTRTASGIFNAADDEPSPPGDPLTFAAQLLDVAPPPEIPFAEAAPSMSPLALSFWQECRRVRNAKLKRELGVALRYPTYREGLKALFDEELSSLRGAYRRSNPDFAVELDCFASLAMTIQCKLGPLRNRLRSLGFTRSSMVSPSR